MDPRIRNGIEGTKTGVVSLRSREAVLCHDSVIVRNAGVSDPTAFSTSTSAQSREAVLCHDSILPRMRAHPMVQQYRRRLPTLKTFQSNDNDETEGNADVNILSNPA